MPHNKSSKKPNVVFLTMFDFMGETIPLIEIAKKYMESGGKAIFAGYGDKYEKLAKDIGCKTIIIRRNYPYPDDFFDEQSKGSIKFRFQHIREKIPEAGFHRLFNKKYEQNYIEAIDNEIKFFKEEKVDLIVTGFVSTSLISARVAKIPVVFLQSGVTIRPFFESNYATFPENYENVFTWLIPQFIKNRLTNWYLSGSKWRIGGFNRLAKKYNVPPVNHFLELFYGDHTLVADDIRFLDVKPTKEFPEENFVGPALMNYSDESQSQKFDPDVEQHLQRPGRCILLTMGSSYLWKEIFLKSLKTLNQTEYNVIATYTTILKENELPNLNDNILLKKFIPNIIKLNQMVDLAIIHGGRGSVYTAAYSGKPVIGIPLHSEQQYNLDNLVRHGMIIRLSKKYFNEKKLLDAIKEIFANYNKYLENAQLLKEKLPKPNGAENAARRILEIGMQNLQT